MKKDNYNQEREELKKELIDGEYQVYSVLRHVSQSGMSRRISFYTIVENKPRYLDWYISKILDYKIGKNEGLIVSGCGMDMGFHVVYNLSSVLFEQPYLLNNNWI